MNNSMARALNVLRMHVLSLPKNVSIFIIFEENFLLIIIFTSVAVFMTKLKFMKISWCLKSRFPMAI